MNRIITPFLAIVLLLLFIPKAAQGQPQNITLNRVSADSLVVFLQKEINPRIFYQRDTGDNAKYSVSAQKDEFLQKALGALRENGYSASEYKGGWYILKTIGFASKLPSGYFQQEKKEAEEDFVKYLTDNSTTVTYTNKVYEIGDYSSQKKGKVTVSGYVKDVTTGEPIAGVSVYQQEIKAYGQTDAYGFYKIVLPVGEHTLGFSGYSLEDLNLSVVVYDAGGLDVQMREKVYALSGAVVSAESSSAHRSNTIGIEKVRINRIKNIPAVFGEADVVKVVLSLPGVKSTGEASSGFNVRGGSTDQNLILFNDGTIYNPNHMFGLFSAFNADVINDIELYKSSIPVQYGGRISSVLEIKGREGNSKKLSGSLGVGVLTSRFHLEGPLGSEKTTFIVGGRTTYSNWILNAMPKNSTYSGGKASFYDMNASLRHKVNENNTIYAYGYYSHDGFGFSNDTTFNYKNIDASVKWRSTFSENHTLLFSAGYDQYDYSIEDTYNQWAAYSLGTSIRQGFAKLNFTSALGEKHKLTYGLNSTYINLRPGMYHPVGETSAVTPVDLATEQAVESALFLSDSYQVNDKLSFDAGVRYSLYNAIAPKSKFYGAPEVRFSGKYSFSPKFSLKAGFNSMRQYIHMISNTTSISPNDTWKLSDDKVKPQEGWQAAAGLYWSVADNQVDLSLEGYYKQMDNYLDYKSGAQLSMNPNLADDLITTFGKAYGVELMVKKPLGKLNGWISYTYSRSMLREKEDRGFETINRGEWYPAAHDKPHDVKLVGNYKFTHRFSLSVNMDYSTGRPVTIPVSKYSYAGGQRLFYSDRNGYRIPDYFRLDLALIVEPSHYLKQLTHLSVTLGVYNVTGRKNAYSVFYTTNNGVRVSGQMLSVFAVPIPYINLNLKF